NFRWHTTIGGQAREPRASIALDTLGGLYISFSTINLATSNNSSVAPHYAPGVALGHSTLTGTSPNNRMITLIKYDTDGNYLWHRMPQDENVTVLPTEGFNHGRGAAYSIIAEPDGTLHWLCSFSPGNHLGGALIVEADDIPDVAGVDGAVYAILKYDKDGNYRSHINPPLTEGGGQKTKKHYFPLFQQNYIYPGRNTNLGSVNGDPVWNSTALKVWGCVLALGSKGMN